MRISQLFNEKEMVTAFPHKAEAKERRNRRTTGKFRLSSLVAYLPFSLDIRIAFVASAIFQPFRAIGYVTSDVPLFVQARGNVHAITTSVGNSFHIYDVGGWIAILDSER